MKKILIIRGHRLNKWEMQNYEPLINDFHMTAIASHEHRYPLNEIKFPVVKLHSIKEMVGRIPKIRGLFNIFTKNMHFRDRLIGLDRYLSKANIVHTLETHLHYIFSYQSALLKKKYRYKMIVTQWENIPFAYEDIPLNRKIKSIVRERTDHFLAITERAKEALMIEGIPEKKITVLNYGIDLHTFYPRPKNPEYMNKLSLNDEDIVILFIGRFVWEKGIFEILLALNKLIGPLPGPESDSIKCIFVGSGEDGTSIRQMVSDLKLEKNVRFLFDMPYRDIPDIHSLADIFVMPSVPLRTLREQYGMVLVEAMAMGKPIISSFCGSIQEVVGDAGLLVQPADHLSLFSALKDLVENPEMRLEFGKKARFRAESRYNRDKSAEKIKQVYHSIL